MLGSSLLNFFFLYYVIASFSCNLSQSAVIGETLTSSDWPVDKGSGPCGQHFPRRVVLNCLRKPAKHTPQSEQTGKPCSSMVSLQAPALGSCPDFPQQRTVTRKCEPNKLSLQVALVRESYHSNRRKKKLQYIACFLKTLIILFCFHFSYNFWNFHLLFL